MEEIWQAMDLLIGQGKVLYVGSANFAGWNIATAQGEAKVRHTMGLGLLPWSPLGGGLLGGVLGKTEQGRRAKPAMQARIDKLRPQLEAYEGFCKELGAEPADVALAWLLHQPAVTTPIIGPRTVEQLEQTLKATDVSLSKDVDRRAKGPPLAG